MHLLHCGISELSVVDGQAGDYLSVTGKENITALAQPAPDIR